MPLREALTPRRDRAGLARKTRSARAGVRISYITGPCILEDNCPWPFSPPYDMYADESMRLELRNCTISNNFAGGMSKYSGTRLSGAVLAASRLSMYDTRLINNFIGNQRGDAGALWTNLPLHMERCTIEDNTAAQNAPGRHSRRFERDHHRFELPPQWRFGSTALLLPSGRR